MKAASWGFVAFALVGVLTPCLHAQPVASPWESHAREGPLLLNDRERQGLTAPSPGGSSLEVMTITVVDGGDTVEAELSPARDATHGASGEPGRVPVESRAEALRSVVRLRDGRALVCTATVTRYGQQVGLLTAAHCLYESSRAGAIGRMRRALDAEGIGTFDPSTARVDPRFVACAQRSESWRECIDHRTEDLAWIPLREVPAVIRPWPLCARPRVPARDVTIFGYGLNGRALPRTLLQGAFQVSEPRGDRGVHRARGVSGVRIDAGDSGGPVIRADDDLRMSGRLPCVQYVAVAVEVSVTGAVFESTALLQPVDTAVALGESAR